MTAYVVRRLLQLIPLLLGITFLSFAMMHLAGSDAVVQKYDRAGMMVAKEVIDAERAQLGLNQPFILQYIQWLDNVLHGNMGVSFVTGRDILTVFLSKLPATLMLAAASVLLTVVISIPLGIIAAVKQNTAVDYGLRFFSFCGSSMPGFFLALVLLYLFAVRIPLFPVIASGTGFQNLVLPAVTLASAMSAKYLRQVRAAVLEELGKEYVIGAKARGIPFSWTLRRSILRSSFTTILTLLALSIGSLLGGTAIVESIFMWDGVGKLAVDAINGRDYPMIQAYVLWMAVIYVAVNLIADIAYSWIDPQIRLKEGRK